MYSFSAPCISILLSTSTFSSFPSLNQKAIAPLRIYHLSHHYLRLWPFQLVVFFEYILLLFYQLISHGQAVRYKKRTWRQGQLTPWGWRHQPVELEARAKCKTLTQVGASTRYNYLEYPVRISFFMSFRSP